MIEKDISELPLKQFTTALLNILDDNSLVLIIKEALNRVDTCMVARLLKCPNVIALETTHHVPYLLLLRLISQGTYLDYLKNKEYFPELSEPQIKRLQYCTIISLANKMDIIPYDVLMKELNIDNIKDLENLIFDAIDLNVLFAELNKKDNCLEIFWTFNRYIGDYDAEDYRQGDYSVGVNDVGANDVEANDVGVNDVDNAIDTIQQFSDSSENVLSTVQACIGDANQTKQSVPKRPKRSAFYENEFARLKKIIITQKRGEELSAGTSGSTKNV